MRVSYFYRLERNKYCGLILDCNYQQGYVDVFMPKYLPSFLQKMMHDHPSRLQRAPHKWTGPAYGQKCQFIKTHPSLPTLNDELTNIIQQQIGWEKRELGGKQWRAAEIKRPEWSARCHAFATWHRRTHYYTNKPVWTPLDKKKWLK